MQLGGIEIRGPDQLTVVVVDGREAEIDRMLMTIRSAPGDDLLA